MITVVGLGDWGSRQLRTLLGLVGPDELIGIDLSAERRAAAEALGVRTLSNTAQLPAAVEAAVVATPTPTHADVGTELLSRDLHVLVEKPLATTVAEARNLVELARARGRVLMVGHVFLFQHAHRCLRAQLDGLGQVRWLAIERRTPGLVKPESGAWAELAAHELAVALDLGALRGHVRPAAFLPWSVTGLGREDGALARLECDGGMVEISCSWLSAVRGRRVWAVADDGQALLVDDGTTQRLAVWPGDPARFQRRAEPPNWADVTGPPPLERELEVFLLAVREGGVLADLPSDGLVGLRVVELLNDLAPVEML